MQNLVNLLKKIHNKGYTSYKQLKGTYQFDVYSLTFDHIQGDPFASPTRISIRIPIVKAGFHRELWNSPARKIALEDFLRRSIACTINIHVKGHRGSGKSGQVKIEQGGQQILLRNAVLLTPEFLEARLTVGLPASGRTVLGNEAIEIFCNELPLVVEKSLFFNNHDTTTIHHHIATVEDQEALRLWLKEQKLVAFIADDAILPRRSGIEDLPLKEDVVPFHSPDTLAFTPSLPNAGKIRGMGIPQGVTLIVGGGFHGKSTLLHALERGIYNHVPGDGREKVATDSTAVKIRAEDGRSISNVNISPFINCLPFGRETDHFTTENASGSTSQAANIIEAIECGANSLLIDEDTSATNFMIRDKRMQQLVKQDKEPITPYLYRIRELHEKLNISTVIVIGGSGDYFDVADTVIMMDNYTPKDVTNEAKQLKLPVRNDRSIKDLPPLTKTSSRKPTKNSLDPGKGRQDIKIDAKDRNTLAYGLHTIDLSKVEQLIDIGQTRTIGWIMNYYVEHFCSENKNLVEGLEACFSTLTKTGLDGFIPYKVGNLALPRLFEVAAAINRIRNAKWEQLNSPLKFE